MKITKREAVALNLWEFIKILREIDESTPEAIIKFYNAKGASLLPEFYLSPCIFDTEEFEIKDWEFLELYKLYSDSVSDLGTKHGS